MIDGFHLLRPEALYALALLPLVALLLRRRAQRSGQWREQIDPELLTYLLPSHSASATTSGNLFWPMVLLAIAIIAAAGPSLQRAEVPVFQRADALVIVLDLSDSMRATDIQPSRAGRARQKILDILAMRKEGLTGLVAFAGDAHVVTPLTDDTRTIENLLPSLTPDIMPIPGANATAALNEAIQLISTAGMANGRILLITDGMPRFDPTALVDTLQVANIELGILGIGTAQGAPMPLPEGGFIRDNNGEIVVPVLDAGNLRHNATAMGGRYQTVTLNSDDIDALSSKPANEIAGAVSIDRRTDTWVDQGHWLVILVVLGLLPGFRRGAWVFVCALSLPVHDASAESLWQDLWQTRDQQGAAALEAGEAGRAASLFENPEWRGSAQYQAGDFPGASRSFSTHENADSLYNLGNALALQGDLTGALGAYERSLAIAPERNDALHNRDLIQQLLDQQEQEQQQDSDNSDDQQNSDDQTPDADGNSDDNGDQGTEDSEKNSEQPPGEGDPPPSDAPPQQSPSDAAGDQGQPQDLPQAAMDRRVEEQTQAQMRKFDEALEQQQKLEQWLRRVPDEPGGLLRNKFRYQSIQRLKNGEKPDEDIRW